MRFLGFIFFIGLLLAVFGYFRGWFSATTARASGKSEITLQLDNNKISDDSMTAARRLGELSANALQALKSLGNNVTPGESELEGTLTTVDLEARDLTLTVGSQTIDLHVPSGIPITIDGENVAFERLRPESRVKLSFEQTGEVSKLSRVALLP